MSTNLVPLVLDGVAQALLTASAQTHASAAEVNSDRGKGGGNDGGGIPGSEHQSGALAEQRESKAVHVRDSESSEPNQPGQMGEPIIRVLPPLVASQIAAGEVVERPASIVKELLENAIDAGATRIRLELDRGGIELVRVTDDGCGMAASQLALAVTPNATSKLRTPQDLLHIGTLGFRGEALASIASVSRCTVRSRRASDAHAHEIEAFGSVTHLAAPKPVAGPKGTSITAANLFFNVPARRTFLRTVNTERDRCLEVFDHAALAHPAIAFTCVSDGHVSREYASANGPASRILAVLGEELASQLFSISASTSDLTSLAPPGTLANSGLAKMHADAPSATLFGVSGLPAIARGTMKGQHIFINGRPIKDRAIQHAIAEAYRGLIEPGRYPTIVLLLEVDPTLVDVNVHPQKSEVRFRDGGLLHSLVLRAVRDGLAKADLTPAASDLGSSALRAGLGHAPGHAPGHAFGRTLGQGQSNNSPSHPQALGQPEGKGVFGSAGAGFRHLTWAPTQPLSWPSTAEASPTNASSEAAINTDDRRRTDLLGAAAPTNAGLVPTSAGLPRGTLSDSKFAEFLGQHFVPGDALPASLAGGLAAGLHATAQTGQIPAVLATVAPGLTPVSILQVHDKYVITADASGIVIIDQHALHERVMFEKLLSRITRGPLESQPLLTPVPVPTTRDAIAMLPALEPLLTRLGLTLAPLGPATVGVQSVPTLLIERSIDIAMFAAELLEKALRGELEADAPGASPATRTQHEHAIRDVLDMMACKAAIKAGDKLSEAELRELLHLRETVERSSNCPHGRPTSMRVSLRELDRLFGRG